MNIRKSLFWLKDALTGQCMRTELQSVRRLNSRDRAVQSVRDQLLKEHLEFVTKEIPFYQAYRGVQSLQQFPILNKETIRDHRTRMIAANANVDDYHESSTSGSTGVPFRVFHDARKRQRINAETIYFGREAGYEVGTRLWHLKIWTDRNRHSFLSSKLKNIEAKDISQFNEADVPKFLLELGKKFGASSIISYSSTLETIARFFQKSNEEKLEGLKISSIIGQSEPLTQDSRRILKQVFGVFPVARYGMEEVGIIAQQLRTSSESYKLNLSSHVVEVLGLENDQPVKTGELGRIVVTDYINTAQPLIRYDTGDLGVVESYLPGTSYVDTLSRLDGRSTNRIYDVHDQPLAPMIAYNFWWMFPEILKYQIVQKSKGTYILRIQVDSLFEREDELIACFKVHVGDTADIAIVYSDDGYQHVSGKNKVIVSEYSPEK